MVLEGPGGVKSRQRFENCDGNKLQRILSFRYFILYDGNYKFADPVIGTNHPSTISRSITMLDAILKFLIFARVFFLYKICRHFQDIFQNNVHLISYIDRLVHSNVTCTISINSDKRYFRGLLQLELVPFKLRRLIRLLAPLTGEK